MNKRHRVHKYFFLFTICILILSLLLPGCDGGAVVGEEEEAEPSKEDIAISPQSSSNQSELTDEVIDIASNFSNEETLSTLTEICYWIKDNFDYGLQADFGRHISKILETRQTSGCHDYGVLFAALARAKGFEVNYIQTFNVDQIQSFQEKPETLIAASGHVFCEVWLNDKWILIDPQAAYLYRDYDPDNEYYPEGKVLYTKGLDSVGIGISNMPDMTEATREVVERVSLSDYAEPAYQRVMLMPGLGESTGLLRIKVIKPDSSPCTNLEVDLWTSSAPAGSPDAGYAVTDDNGIVVFEVPAGDYKIGFNLSNFPMDEFILQRQKVPATVKEKDTEEVTIQLEPK